MKLTLTILCIVGAVFADTFLHGCMEGSNNKLNEERGDINRDNANRLFDSQNGNGGGYYTNPIDVGDAQAYRKYYYSGSELSLQWVNQHGSGDNVYVRTNFVWQWMCDTVGKNDAIPWTNEGLRDGTTTDTIGESQPESTSIAHGRHEPWAYYDECGQRERNKGLFTADQNLQGDTAQYSRQNPDGDQYGYECAEERDYFPYWHPTPWVDFAYLTSTPDAKDMGGCKFIKKNSFNVQEYHYCVGAPTANNEQDCSSGGGQWKAFGPWNKFYDFIDEPDCQESEWSKENHLGHGRNGQMNQYNFTVMDAPDGSICVLRLRYNMTQFGDLKDWNLDHKSNDDNSPVQQRDNNGGANDRIENWAGAYYPDVAIQLAVNTNQFFRTFQDRTHSFVVRERPSEIDDRAKIYNLGNKGNRGNLQTLYPMVENDFCPEKLVVRKGDYVHVQFQGANYGRGFNRNNAAGAGRTGGNRANRVNMMQLASPDANYPMRLEDQTFFEDEKTAVLAAFIGQDPADCNPNQTAEQADDNCSKLNASDSGYLDMGLIQPKKTGTFFFASSRNNHNTNRAMKTTIVIDPALSWVAILLIVLATLLTAGAASVGVLAQQSKQNPGGRAAQMWDRLASAGGASFGGGY